VEAGELRVYAARAWQIPHVLAEIGRLRELTYRAVGEGTRAPRDTDPFDAHYVHLFLWHTRRREVVGAYRTAPAGDIVGSLGVEGLYTRTLFRYDASLTLRLGPSLELGRSFVRAEYQRRHSPLALLWKGIGALVAREPRYRVLFGAVSISARYDERTRKMLVAFLEAHHRDGTLSEEIVPIHPYSPDACPSTPAIRVPQTVEEADSMVRGLEPDGCGMPVLLRQYLKLNARLLGFSVDPLFGGALDALMMVDLAKVGPRILRRYLGAAGMRVFVEYHAGAFASHAA
jgi:putative hemolysin